MICTFGGVAIAFYLCVSQRADAQLPVNRPQLPAESVGSSNGVGRYQLVCGKMPGYDTNAAFVIDTQTGRVWEKNGLRDAQGIGGDWYLTFNASGAR